MRSKLEIELELSLIMEAAPRLTRDELDPFIDKLIQLSEELQIIEKHSQGTLNQNDQKTPTNNLRIINA